MLDEKILGILRSNADSHVSGEEMCGLAGISRAAIWKHIEKLRGEGYDIEASPHLGYRLVGIPDSLIPDEIKWKLKTKLIGKSVISYKKVDSTNTVAYGLAEKGMKEGAVILAEEQALGKWRQGRRWVSPSKGGIYLSCILRPHITPNEIPKITLLSAVAAAKSIRLCTALDAMIKWPNDILINNRKVCGILTEMKAEQDMIDFIIIGIGINVNTPIRLLPKGASSLKEELRRGARAEDVSRVELTRRLLENLESGYFLMKKHGFRPIIDEWKELSAMPGSRIKVIMQNRQFEGQVHDIDEQGSLVVRTESGVLEKVSSGDIVMAR
ncbi:MAG: biotin--[acetyl-CoA-carboxylase] ligase [Candidatus Omnitrophica bacterium]|nr:biotin--[acetyl-CoA-carboxylase] ligase [Candidatus Omnitrophota bacterium]